jgi:S-(hydroxymethyl)glutathione dehydrogenase/alcohol dehydrogenase
MTTHTIRAAVIEEPGTPFVVRDVVVADPVGAEVLVDVRASGLCHSDLHFAQSGLGLPAPFVLGHEIAGVVLAIGDDVSGLAPGDHVVGTLIQACGECDQCRAHRPYRCSVPGATMRGPEDAPRLRSADAPVFGAFGLGGFAERVLTHQNQLVRIDPAVPFPEACLLGCSVITGVGAVLNAARVREGESVVVIGLGGVGLNVLSGARLAGAGRIVGVDVNPAKLELARKLGATDVIDASAGDPTAAVLDRTGGGADHVFEVIGRRSTAEQAIGMLGVGGTAWMIGIHQPGQPIEVDVNTLLAPQRGIRGVFMGASDFRVDIPRYAELFLRGELNLTDLVSSEIGIDDINDAYERLRAGETTRSVITSFRSS